MAKFILVMASLIFFMIDHPSLAKSNDELVLTKINNNQAVEATSLAQKTDLNNPISVKHQVKGNDIYVECVISNFNFSARGDKEINKNGFGYLQLYLNGKKIDNIYTAAFIIKGLPVGKHQIKLVLVHNDSTPYGVSEEFEVTI